MRGKHMCIFVSVTANVNLTLCFSGTRRKPAQIHVPSSPLVIYYTGRYRIPTAVGESYAIKTPADLEDMGQDD